MKQQHGTALSLYALAEVGAVGGDSARSQALYEQGVGVARESGDKRAIPSGLEGLAAAVAAQGNYIWAAHLWVLPKSCVRLSERPSHQLNVSPTIGR